MKTSAKILLLAAMAAIGFTSCSKSSTKIDESDRKVMILYSAGFNSLNSYLQTNINELKQGWLPTNKKGQDVVLVVSKPRNGTYANQTSPVLIRMYKNGTKAVMDTVKTYALGRKLVDVESFKSIMMDIKSLYPAKSYGMVFSSHATGWLPNGYYSNPDYFENRGIRQRTIGQEEYVENSVSKSTEMEVEEMASALPYKLDYLLIDACLAGCVEVAYAFKGKADMIGFSQAEVLSEGFDYTTMAERILNNNTPEKVCEAYIDRYMARTGIEKSATISVVKPSEMDNLASVCKGLIEKYRTQINALHYSSVQEYGGTKHWFFDLKDIFVQAGATDDELKSLDGALSKCIYYKGHTGQYYSATDSSTHQISIFSGLTMYLPSVGGNYLHSFYKNLSWNKAVQLVK